MTVEEIFKTQALGGLEAITKMQVQKALDNSLLTVGAYLAGQPIGMGRIVGDGAVICYIQDLVPPQAQGLGVGSMILRRLKNYVEEIRMPGTEMMLDLMCAKGREEFYTQHGFLARPTENLRPGMILYLHDKAWEDMN